MFIDCSSLRTIELGESFTFEGSDSSCLPDSGFSIPSGNGFTGRWISSEDGRTYASGSVSSYVAAIYTAEQKAAFQGAYFSFHNCLYL